MKKIFSLIVLLLVTRALAVTPVPYQENVSVSSKISGTGTTTLTVYGESTVAITNTVTATTQESALSTVRLRPNRVYPVNFSGNTAAYWLNFTAPDGYSIYINNLPSDLYARSGLSGSYSHDYTLEIRPVADDGGSDWGNFSGVALGKSITWKVGLGNLRTGRGAGSIIFKEADISANAASRALLYYSPPLNVSQIFVVKDGASNQTLRQICTPIGFTDLVDVTGGYEIRFYDWGQVTGSSAGLWTFSGSPWKTIKVEAPVAGQLKVTETEGSASPVVRVSKLTQTGNVTPIGATGGTVTTDGSYTIHTFNSSDTFVLNGGISTVDYLVVGGGGGGGNNYGGGGGAGDVKTGSVSVSNIAYAIVVGLGGSSATGGSASVFNGISASGGGAGGSTSSAGSAGGSGGGGASNAAGGTAGSGSNVHSGGAGDNGSYGGAGGGGGGAGTVGGGLATGTFGGGTGISSSISGSPKPYGGGGGGGAADSYHSPTSGGSGIGGSGTYQFGNPGTVNTGSGGGGAGGGYNGGGGGSGVVIVRYLTPSGTEGDFTWTLEEGNGSVVARTTTHVSNRDPVSGLREVIVEVGPLSTAGTVATRTKYHYATQPWGSEELDSVVTDPTASNPLERTTSYAYHTTAPSASLDEYRGNYRRIKSITYPTGNWVAYHYFNDWDQRGQLKYEFHPYLDAPVSPPSVDTASAANTAAGASGNGRVITLAYTYDWTGRYRELYSRTEKINNVTTANTTRDQDYDASTTLARMRYNENAYWDLPHPLTTHIEYYRADAGDADILGQLLLSRSPNGNQTSRSVCRGTFNPSTKAFSMSGAGDHWREITFHGSSTNASDWGAADAVTSYDGQTCDLIYMIRNKSTMDLTIRIGTGVVYRTETYVYTGSSPNPFSLLKSEDFTYDGHGHLTQRFDSNGALASSTWTKGQLTSAVAADGTETQFTYDEIGRAKSSITKGASTGVTNDITTTYTYDGANHVKQTVSSAPTIAGPALSLTSSATYDLSGRLSTSVAPGNYTTNYSYTGGGKVVTTTLPSDSTQTLTRVDEIYLDGQLKSQRGSTRVEQAFTYSVNGSSGNITRQLNFGGSSSAILKTTSDWLGRAVSEVKPGWNGSDVTRTWEYNSSGQVFKVSQPGVAPMFYTYDSVGTLYMEYLHAGSGTNVDETADRITKHQWAFFPVSSAWWRREITSGYATAGSAATTQLGKVETQVSGFPSGRFARTDSYDVFGNVTTTTVDLDRATKKSTTTVDFPDSTIDAVQIAYNGLTTSSKDKAGNITTLGYDELGRAVTSTDPRTGTTTTAYITGSSQIATVKDPTTTPQATYTYDDAGRVSSVKDALNKFSYTEYTERNEVKRQWGDTATPVEYGYDNWGHKTTMKTYRGGSDWNRPNWASITQGTADVTRWDFQEATGLLSSKDSAYGTVDAKTVSYTYKQAGQIATRQWARILSGTTHITTTYDYSTTTGELTSVDYNDATTDLAYAYNRLGNIATVTDATGTRTLNYNLGGTLELQSEDLPSFFSSKRITYPVSTTGVIGRSTGLQLGSSGSPTADQSITYGYDTYGRFNALTGGGQTFSYGYAANSNLVATVTNSAANYTDTRAYDPKHDWIDNRQTKIASAIKAEFAYTQDAMGRITAVKKTGEVFNVYGSASQGLDTAYDYTDRSELKTESTNLGGTTTALTGRNDSYQYDTMGNRAGSAGTTHNSNSSGYTTNALNQYTQRTVPGYFDVSGALAGGTVTVSKSGGPTHTATRHGAYFFDAYPLAGSAAADYASLTVGDGTSTYTLPAFVPGTPEAMSYDDDGNLTSDGRWDYAYDAENRLISMQTHTGLSPTPPPNSAARRLEFLNDYLGRRVEKVVRSGWNGSAFATVASDEKFVYDGWNLMARLNAASSNAILASYYWGTDLSGSMQGAGGVGGLLLIKDSTGSYLPTYDGNGNVHGLITISSVTLGGTPFTAGDLVAAYEYDGFGNTLREAGPYAASNPFRYSTKFTDLDTGLIYYGLRYYSPTLGRFINKDPIEERGGLNLYGFCGNNGINRWDYLGQDARSDFNLYFGRPSGGSNGGLFGGGSISSGGFGVNPPFGSYTPTYSIGSIPFGALGIFASSTMATLPNGATVTTSYTYDKKGTVVTSVTTSTVPAAVPRLGELIKGYPFKKDFYFAGLFDSTSKGTPTLADAAEMQGELYRLAGNQSGTLVRGTGSWEGTLDEMSRFPRDYDYLFLNAHGGTAGPSIDGRFDKDATDAFIAEAANHLRGPRTIIFGGCNIAWDIENAQDRFAYWANNAIDNGVTIILADFLRNTDGSLPSDGGWYSFSPWGEFMRYGNDGTQRIVPEPRHPDNGWLDIHYPTSLKNDTINIQLPAPDKKKK